MAEMGARMEQSRLSDKHGEFSLIDSLMDTAMGQTLMVTAAGMFLLVLIAGVLMISSSINTSVAQRTQFFGMMRCIGMSKQQIIRFVRLEALNWCKTAVPIGLVLGILVSWVLCAALRFFVGEEFSNIPLFGISGIGIVSGILVGVITVLLAARTPAKHAARVSPLRRFLVIPKKQKQVITLSIQFFSGLKRRWVFTMLWLQRKPVFDDRLLCFEYHSVFELFCSD